MKRYTVGVDFGGTWIKAVLMDKRDRVVRKTKLKTGNRENREEVMKNIVKSVERVISGISRDEIIGIGIGVPGIVNTEKGMIEMLPNVSSFSNFPIKKRMESLFKLSVRVDNDSLCVALGESTVGAGRGVRNLVCITLGTGVGGGIITDNRVYRGNGRSGRIGHVTVEPDGRKCSCGSFGCLEEYVSARAIERLARKRGLEGDPKRISELAKKGNTKAIEVYSEVGRYLGIGLSDIIKILDPDLILVGGGISKAGKIIITPAKKEIRKRLFFSPPEIKPIKLKDWAGAVGAACLFLQ